ncbi:hypothetical protein BJV82DRAFT_681590 [Fennellomyces sp. T-0311]|nr:hypothetical protein BJV82DRAFT_681590 [Fennellomyces sp. T-0311]
MADRIQAASKKFRQPRNSSLPKAVKELQKLGLEPVRTRGDSFKSSTMPVRFEGDDDVDNDYDQTSSSHGQRLLRRTPEEELGTFKSIATSIIDATKAKVVAMTGEDTDLSDDTEDSDSSRESEEEVTFDQYDLKLTARS